MAFQKGHRYGVRFQPGRSGNPAGRPKSKTLSEALRLALVETGDKKSHQTNADLIAQAIVKKALNGDVRAFVAIADLTEGKAPRTVSVTSDIQTEVNESRREWAEKTLTEIMQSAKLTRAKAIKQLRAAGATRMLELLGESPVNPTQHSLSRTRVL